MAVPLGAAAGCSGGSKTSTKPLEKITYLTAYGTFGRDGFIYVAKERGYFADAGFDVDIKVGAGTGANIKQILAGSAMFTPVDTTGCLLAAGGKNKVSGFTAVAGIHQRTLASIISLKGNGITQPRDLENKTLSDLPGSINRSLFPTYAKLADFDYKTVKWVDATPATVLSNLTSGKFLGIGQFVVGKATIETMAKGREAVVLPYSDYLADLYGNSLITSTAYAKKNPDKVKTFTAALLKGLSDSVANPAEMAKILKKYVPATNLQAATAEMNLMVPYVLSAAAGVQVGALEIERIERCIAILQGSGQIDPGLAPEQVVSVDLVPKAS
jgi:NitT/TauT family transport system substrate-binding protein